MTILGALMTVGLDGKVEYIIQYDGARMNPLTQSKPLVTEWDGDVEALAQGFSKHRNVCVRPYCIVWYMYVYEQAQCVCVILCESVWTHTYHLSSTLPNISLRVQMYYSYQNCTAPSYKPAGLPKKSATRCRLAFHIDHPVPNAVLRYRIDNMYYGDARFYLSFSPKQV